MTYETTIGIGRETTEYLRTRGLPVEGDEVDIEVDFDVESADPSVGIMSISVDIVQVYAVSPDGKIKVDVTDESWLPDFRERCCEFVESERQSAEDAHYDAQYERLKDEHYFGGE